MTTQSINLFTSEGKPLTTLTSRDESLCLPNAISVGNDGATAHHADSGDVEYESLDALCEAYGLCLPEVLALGFPDRVHHRETVLLLTQDAYGAMDPVAYQNPRAGEACYLALAVDAEGKQYRVTWYPREDGEDGEDEGDACDWDSPSRIEKL